MQFSILYILIQMINVPSGTLDMVVAPGKILSSFYRQFKRRFGANLLAQGHLECVQWRQESQDFKSNWFDVSEESSHDWKVRKLRHGRAVPFFTRSEMGCII